MTTAPRIVCRAGPSLDKLTDVDVNRSSLPIDGPHFFGSVAVRLKDYRGPKAQEGKSVREPEQPFMEDGTTWSISFQGTFKEQVTADEVVSRRVCMRPSTPWRLRVLTSCPFVRQLFGNTWEKPIKSVRSALVFHSP